MAERQRKPQVLVVDDEEDMCWALRLIITTEGRDCVSVNTATEAMRIVTTQPFRLAFVDVKLPDMNGFDLVRCLQHQVPGLPCVLVSGFLYHDDVVVQEGLQSGLIAGFVGKPFLLDQIRTMLDRFTASVHVGHPERAKWECDTTRWYPQRAGTSHRPPEANASE